MIKVSYHDKVNVLQDHKLTAAGPFARLEWFALLEAGEDTRPFAIEVGNESGSMAMMLRHGKRRVEPLINWYSFTWRPVFTERADRNALLDYAARYLKQHAARVTLWPLPDEDDTATLVETSFRKAGWTVFRSQCDTNHILNVQDGDFETYLASRPGTLRTTLKRKSKKVETTIFSYFNDNIWNIYERIYAKSWKPEEGDRRLLRDFATTEGEAGRIRIGIARHEGQPVAAQFWTVEDGTAYIHKLAHLEDAQNLSAGSVLTAALMRHVIETDCVKMVDFGTGNDSYKSDWMNDIRPRFELDCHDTRNPHSWPHILRGTARRVASRLRAG